MFEALYGYVVSQSPDSLVIGPGADEEGKSFGFAYRIFVAKPNRFPIQSHQVFLIYHHKGEYADNLYGFEDHDERRFFRDLIGVKGVGPKAALNIMMLAPIKDIQQAIRMGNAAFLCKAKGVNKAAGSIILDLGKKYANAHFEESHPELL